MSQIPAGFFESSPNSRQGRIREPASTRKGILNMHHNATVNQPVNPTCFAGIDMAKDTFVVAWTDGKDVTSLPNTPEGHAACIALLEPMQPQRIVVEATGGYEKRLLVALGSAGLPIVRINPKRVRDYANSQGVHGKTDKLDAFVMVDFATQLKDPQRLLPDEKALELQEMTTRQQQLVKMITAEKNRQQTFYNAEVQQDVQVIIDALQNHLKQLEKRIDDMIDQHEPWAAKARLLQTTCGIGPANARSMVAHLPELGCYSRQIISALVGVAPYHRDSGKRKGKRRIHGGRAQVRSLLYMAALTATRHNPVIKVFYQRLKANGKCEKVAITACMRKLLTILNAMIRDQSPWKDTQLT